MKAIQFDSKAIYPSKVVCIGRNYVAHINELNHEIPEQAVIFLKPNSAISSEIYHNAVDEIHYEGEISFLIESGKISAVGFGLDLTKRDIQSTLKAKGLPWERAKAFDNSAVFSEFKRFKGNIDDLRLELYINGELVQQGGCDLMLFKPRSILAEVKNFLTLENDDVIMSGTPSGVGKVNRGDEFIGKVFEQDELIVEQHWLVK